MMRKLRSLLLSPLLLKLATLAAVAACLFRVGVSCAEQPALRFKLGLSIKLNQQWSDVSLSALRTQVSLSVNCGCETTPTLLALSARINSPTENSSITGEILLAGDRYLTQQTRLQQCPATIPVIAAVGPLRMAGDLIAMVQDRNVYFSGELFETGKSDENSSVKLTVSNLQATPSTFCPSTGETSSTRGPSSRSANNQKQAAATNLVAAAFNNAVINFAELSPGLSSGTQSSLIDSFGRLKPVAMTNAESVDVRQTVTPPCPLGFAGINPNNKVVACDGSHLVMLNFGPLPAYYNPAQVNAGPGFLSIPGLISGYGYQLELMSNISASIRLITPSGEAITFVRQGLSNEYRPANPSWDILGNAMMRYEGSRAMSITANIQGSQWTFNRITSTSTNFSLVSIHKNGKIVYQRVGSDQNNPTGFWLGDGETASFYVWDRSDVNSIALRLVRNLGTSGRATPANQLIARLNLVAGTLESIVSDDYATSFIRSTLASGKPVITGLMAGPIEGPIDYWQSWTVDSTGKLLGFSTGSDRSPTHSTLVSYTDTAVTVNNGGNIVRYEYSLQNDTPLLTGRVSKDSAESYTYDPARGGALLRVTDTRFPQPLYELLKWDSGRSIGWRDLIATYNVDLSQLNSTGSYRIVITPLNTAKAPSSVEVRRSERSETKIVSQGKVEVTTTTTVGDTDLHSTTVVKVDGKTVEDSSMAEELGRIDANTMRISTSIQDLITGVRASEQATSAPNAFSSISSILTPNGLRTTTEYTQSTTSDKSSSSFVRSFEGKVLDRATISQSSNILTATRSRENLGAFLWLKDLMELSRQNGSELIRSYQVWEDAG